MRDPSPRIRLRVGRNIQRLRLLRGWSQERLSELVGIAEKHMGRVERGEVNVGIDTLSKTAVALSVDVADLFIAPRRRAGRVSVITTRDLETIERIARTARTGRASASRTTPRNTPQA